MANAVPNANPQAGSPGTQNSTTQSKDPNKPKSGAEPIESTVVKKFQDDVGRVMEVGQPFLYTPKEGMPYPWPLIRPNDESLGDKLRSEYEDFMEAKNSELNKRGAVDDLVRRISERG